MKIVVSSVLVILVAVVSFVIGTRYSRPTSGTALSESGGRVLFYACPMHPRYRSNRPGDCLSCGMRLEAVYEDRGGVGGAGGAHTPPDATQVDRERQRLLGVRLAKVERSAGTRTLRTSGRVATDENRLYRLNSSTELWVRKVHPPTTGSLVRKNQPLLEFYSTNFLSAAAAYLYALNTQDRQVAAQMSDANQTQAISYQLRQAMEGLQNLGVSDLDIEEMARTRKPRDLVTLRSPADGIVLSRTATMGQWVGSSSELYQIADLSRVWIFADVFEYEAGGIRPGMAVHVSAPNKGLSFTAKVSDVPPAFDEATRIMKVRLDAENPGLRLWPGMFVEVEFPVRLPAALAVPVEAVIDSGLKKTVYVAKGDGYFEPRLVETGWKMGDRVEITRGLREGEQIVVSGNFLLDSESRMRMTSRQGDMATKGHGDKATGRQGGLAGDPVCGMQVDPTKAAGKSEYRGKTYYFCSAHCKQEFDEDPAAVLSKSQD